MGWRALSAWALLLAVAGGCSNDGDGGDATASQGGSGGAGGAGGTGASSGAGTGATGGNPTSQCTPTLSEVLADAPFPPSEQTPFVETGLVLAEWSLPCVPVSTGVEQTECNHHGSTIAELPGGGVGVVWYHGEFEKSKDSRLVWSTLAPGAANTGWSDTEVIFDDPDLSEGNAALWVHEDGTLFVFFATIILDAWHEARVRFIKSTDGGETWSPATTLREDFTWNARHRPVRLDNGDLLLPCYNESLALPVFFRSSDDFETWEELADLPLLDHVGQIQPALFKTDDGSIVALTRDGTRWSRIQRMVSDDNGDTWSKSQPTELPNPGTSIDAVKLANGHVAVVFNNDPDSRRPLSVALSLDDGLTFSAVRDIPIDCPDCELHYPSIMQRQTDGTIWISYTHDRKTIGWVQLNEAWLSEGTDAAHNSCNAGQGYSCTEGQCVQACNSDAACADGLACVGGRCSKPCENDGDCCGSCSGGACEERSVAVCVSDK